MELHFIWINNYNYLRKAAVNLSSRFIIEYDYFEQEQHKNVLHIRHNPDFIENFFEKNNVLNVTAIIGKNGAGKSSILDYIKGNLPEGLQANITSDIFVYSHIEDGSMQYFVYYPPETMLNLDDKTNLFKLYEYDDIRFEGAIADAEFIYYSFLFDYRSANTVWGGLRDISTSFLMSSERTRIIEENQDEESRKTMLSYASDADNFIVNEMGKTVEFIVSESSHLIPFKKPSELLLFINDTDRLYFNKRNRTNVDVYELLSKFDEAPNSTDLREMVIDKVSRALFINFVITERKYSSGIISEFNFNYEPNESRTEFILQFFRSLKDLGVSTPNVKNVYVNRYEELSSQVPSFIEYITKLLDEKVLIEKKDHNNTPYLVFPLKDKNQDNLNELMNLYLKVKGVTTFLDFRWRGLSSGEQSFLSFMARFYHVKKHDRPVKKDLIILIDEGDVGFHPEWQRNFFNVSLSFLSNLFSDHSIQLIFTANSPFISSDLPKSNVIFIERKGNKPSLFHGKDNDREETFGANIHILLSNSFYMDGALIGQFAKDKIDRIIDYLDPDVKNQPNVDYKKTIEMIGEPILRNKLLQMWATKFGPAEEIAYLRQRIKEIEESNNINNDKNNP